MALTSLIVIPVGLHSGFQTFPSTPVPVGVSAITVAIDRSSLIDPTVGVGWALELSLTGDAGPWIPWGSSGTGGGVIVSPTTKSIAGASSMTGSLIRRLRDGSIEPGFEPSNANRRLRGSLSLTQAVTTKVTITLDDSPVPSVIATGPFHQSVTFDNNGFFSVNTATTVTTPSFSISSSANRAGLLGLCTRTGGLTAFSGSMGGVSGSAISGTDSGSSGTARSLQFGVTAPPSGSQTATMSWTGAGDVTLGASTAYGVDQITPFNNGTFAIGTNPLSVTITSINGDLTIDTASVAADFLTSTTPTQIYNETAVAYGASSRGPGTGTTTHSWTASGTETKGISGVNLVKVQGVIPSTGAYQQEQNTTDRYQLEDGSGVYLIEPWGTAVTQFPPRWWGDLDGIGKSFPRDRLG